MRREIFPILCVSAFAVFAIVQVGPTALAAASRQNANAHPSFINLGCSNCHGDAGQGSIAGPRLAPNPLAFEQFQRAVRHPRAEMPVYTEAAIPDVQLKEIYEYMTRIRDTSPKPNADR